MCVRRVSRAVAAAPQLQINKDEGGFIREILSSPFEPKSRIRVARKSRKIAC